MKKILALTLALVMALSLAACGDKPTSGDGGNSSAGSTTQGGDSPALTQKDIDDANEAWDKLEEMFYAEDWRWDKEDDSGYINGKWDEGVMYDPVPAPPADMHIQEMQYNGKKSRKYQETATIGDMYIDGTDYEYISVDFDCSKAQLEEMVQSYTDAGWLVKIEEDYGNGDMWHFYYKGDYYAYLRAGEFMADEGYEVGCYLTVMPAYYTPLKSVGGVKLPQCGILTGQGWIDGYDKDFEYIEDEIPVDTPADKLPPLWMYSNEDIGGVSVDDIKAYRDQMVADGWTVAYEQEDPAYAVTLRKGDLRIECGVPYSANNMNILIANNDDLYY